MTIQGNLNEIIKATRPPRNKYKKEERKLEAEENEKVNVARPLYTLTPGPLESATDLSLVDQTLLTHFIKNSYFQGTPCVVLSFSILSKITKIDHITTLVNHLEELEKKGYYRIVKTVGQTNIYCLNVDKIETDFNFKIEDYYQGYNERIKRHTI